MPTHELPKNPSLASLEVLLGTWHVTMNHVQIPEPVSWRTIIEWLDNAFIIAREDSREGSRLVPESLFLISRNENHPSNQYVLLSYDSRGVSRTMSMSFEDGVWKNWREDADFYQRQELKLNEAGDEMTGAGQLSYDKGKTWQHDYSLTYRRVK